MEKYWAMVFRRHILDSRSVALIGVRAIHTTLSGRKMQKHGLRRWVMTLRSHIQSTETAMFYELAHGGSYYFHNICPDGESITATEVETWIACYTKMPFTFIGSCGGLCELGPNTLSYAFRKGSSEDTVTVGYCGMGTPECANAWVYSVRWQDTLFRCMNQGDTVGEAFDRAMVEYPTCLDCMRIAGDEEFASVPVVKRGGIDDIAIFRNGVWCVDTTGNHVADLVFGYGIPGDVPLVGNFGSDDIAIFRNGMWCVDTTGNHIADLVFGYGIAGDVPLVGDFNKEGTNDIAIFRNGLWCVDTTSNHVADLIFGYGIPGDVPLVGNIG